MSAQPVQPQPTPRYASAETLALVERLKELAHELYEKDPEMFSRYVTYLDMMLVDESDEGYALWRQAAAMYSLPADE